LWRLVPAGEGDGETAGEVGGGVVLLLAPRSGAVTQV
jgi:hypothetical protein